VLTSPHDRAIWRLAWPALGSLAADPLVSIVDTAFVGQLGQVPLAALGVNASVFALTFMVFNFLAYGTTPRVGRALGRGDRAEAGRVVVRAFVIAAAAGVGALALLQAFAVPVLRLMGASGELLEAGLVYLRIRACAGPAVLLITAGNGAFRGFQNTRTPLVITLALNAVNLTLDPLLIFGLGWGLAGAATATLAAQWAGAAAFVWLLFGPARRPHYGIELRMPAWASLVPFLRIGRDLLIRTGALVGTMTLATAVATRVGTEAIAAHQIAMQFWYFLALAVDALAVAAQALVAKHLGSDDAATARSVARRLVQWSLATGLVLGAGIGALGGVLPPLFTGDAATLAFVRRVWPFVAVMQPINALVFVGDGLFMGAERFGYLAVAMLASAAVGWALLLGVRPFGWGLVGVWWALVAFMAARALTLGVPYVRGTLVSG
jgi:MATE family multidrug resistance protein